MRVVTSLAACGVVAAMLVTPVGAQPRLREKGFIAVNGTAQIPTSTKSDTFTFEQYVETGTVDVRYRSATAAQFDLGAGVRIGRRTGIGLAIARAFSSNRASIGAQVPHPLFDNRHRSVEGEASGLSRTQTAAHAHLYYETAVTPKLRLRVSAGPSYFRLSHQLVDAIAVNDTYPFETAVFRRATLTAADGAGWGAHGTVDLSWMFTRRLGVGGLIRYSGAKVDLNAGGGRTVSWDGGGFESGGGVRVAF